MDKSSGCNFRLVFTTLLVAISILKMTKFLPILLGTVAILNAEFEPTAQDRIVPKGAKLELLWSDAKFTEGPAAAPDGNIYFTSIRTARIMRFEPKTGKTTLYRKDSGKANGLMFDRQGRLVACEGSDHGNIRVSITDKDGTIRTLADKFEGKRLNSPNDLFITPKGRIYFTDPRYIGHEPRELDFEGVYLIEPDSTLKLATRKLQRPNGILISRDEKTAYVADHHSDNEKNRHLVAFRIRPDGTFGKKTILHDFGEDRGIDGMAMDTDGNLYTTAGTEKTSGIYVFSPDGGHLARIPLPGAPTNCAFGKNEDNKTLYITAAIKGREKNTMGAFGLYRIRLGVTGRHAPTE